MIQVIPRRKLYQEIAERIEQTVISGSMTPGDRLPPAHQLSKQFGVSLTAVREAVHALAERGLVEIRHGQGTFIALPSSYRASEAVRLFFQLTKRSVAELMEARRAVELETAALAAIRRDEEDLRKIDDALDSMKYLLRNPAADPEPFFDGDVQFHSCIARATRNEIFTFTVMVLHDLLLRNIRKVIRPAEAPRQAVAAHEKILAALRQRDSDGARETMRSHLLKVQQIYALQPDESVTEPG